VSVGRTVTVQTLDHGPVVLVEPDWCVAVHEDGNHRSGIRHDGVEYAAAVTTPDGEQIEFLRANLQQFPFSESGSRAVSVVVDINGDHPEFDPAGLWDLASTLTGYALHTLLPLREQLRAIEEETR
jgi:hypothetical protein